MPEFSFGFTCKVGDGASPEAFTALLLFQVPEPFSGAKATYPDRNTGSTGNTKQYATGLEEGDELALVTRRNLDDTAQDALRTAYNAGGAGSNINLQFIFADGTTTETNTAPFLVTSMPITPSDPNGDGDPVLQTFNVKRNGDWTTAEA